MKLSSVLLDAKLPIIAVVLLAAALFATHARAQGAPPVDVTDGCGHLVLGKSLMLLRDEQRSLTIDDVVRPPVSDKFKRSSEDKPNFGYTEAAYWVQLSLVNNGDAEVTCLLEYDYALIDEVELYTPRESGGFDVERLGDQEPFHARKIKNANPVFEVHVPPKGTAPLTLRISTEGSLQIPLVLHGVYEFLSFDHERQIVWGVFFGLVLVMALYNLFLFFSIRDKAYLAYVAYVLSIAGVNLSIDGIVYEYFVHDWPVLSNRVAPIFVSLAGLFGTIFTALFLKSKVLSPFIHRVFTALCVYFVVTLPIALFGSVSLSARIHSVSGGLWSIPLLLSAIYIWRVKGYAPARFYLLAWGAFLIATPLLGMRYFGIFPNTFLTAHGLQVGSAAEVVLLSFALADRIKLLEKEKKAAMAARLIEREHAEEIQRGSAQAWQSTFDAIGSGVCLLDGDGKVLRVNQAATEILGQSEKDIIGAQLKNLLKEASGSASSTPPPGFDTLLERVEGFIEFKQRWYSVRHDPIRKADGELTGSVHVMTDVTGQRDLEQQLYQAQKMDAIGRLAGGVAHDFNNLLSVIISYGEFLVESATDPESKADAEEIVKAGQRAATLTGQLLAFSRKQVLKSTVFAPNDAVTDLSKMMSRLIKENIRLEIELDEKPVNVLFPRGQLDQILVNLVVNARDAIQGPGTISIQTGSLSFKEPKQLTTGELPAGKYVSLCVCDSGEGMDRETVQRIFEPFFTTKGQGKGTGLGLAMVYGAVHQAGGAIDVFSSRAKGTRITVYLPRVVDSTSITSHPPVWDEVKAQGQTVLVVEDEPPVLAAVCKILTSAGFKVIEANNAEAALEILERKAQEIDVLLTDIIMSGMTGVELGTKAAELDPDIRLLYMSGYGFEALADQGIDPATVHILHKPFTREKLLAALAGWDN